MKKQKKHTKKNFNYYWRHAIFPILGLAVVAVGLGIVGRMDYETERIETEAETAEAEAESYAEAEAVDAEDEDLSLDIPYGLSLEDVYELARVTYLETGFQGEGYEYVTYLTACVIINRYLDWGYDSIEAVTHDAGQYATADWDAEEINAMTWQAVRDALVATDRSPHFQACDYYLEGTGLTLYYDDGVTQIYY